TREETVSPPFGEYGVNKKAIEDYLLGEARRGDFPATMVNPGHIVGPGHEPVNPMACKSPQVFSRLAKRWSGWWGSELLTRLDGLEAPVRKVVYLPIHHPSRYTVGEG
ncbi:MAG: hypothetical protein ACOC7V_15985, partial [Spirochaetota bacterium]